MSNVKLLVSSSAGIYIPREFCESIKDTYKSWRIDKDDLDVCLDGPDNEYYCEAWESILDNAWCTDGTGDWGLYHDGDLWAVNTENMTSEEYQNFFGE